MNMDFKLSFIWHAVLELLSSQDKVIIQSFKMPLDFKLVVTAFHISLQNKAKRFKSCAFNNFLNPMKFCIKNFR
jgi:hypothetical protein